MRSLASALLLIAACSPGRDRSDPQPSRRAKLETVGHNGGEIKILPGEHQPPYCLAFSVSEKGVVRQLTMTPANESIPCPAGEPVGGVAYQVPVGEGRVRIHVIFSDRKLDATPIGAQVHELGRSAGFSAMDLRAPGQVLLETLEIR